MLKAFFKGLFRNPDLPNPALVTANTALNVARAEINQASSLVGRLSKVIEDTGSKPGQLRAAKLAMTDARAAYATTERAYKTAVSAYDEAVKLPGIRQFGGIGGGILKLGGAVAVGSAIDFVLNETRMGEDMSGAGRMLGKTASFGLKMYGGVSMIKGATGSALYWAGAATGRASRFHGAYTGLGNIFKQGGRAIGQGLGAVATTPVMGVVGLPYAAVAVARGGLSMIGRGLLGSHTPFGDLAGLISGGRIPKFMDSLDVARAFSPSFGFGKKPISDYRGMKGKKGGGYGRTGFAGVASPKTPFGYREAPIMRGVFMLGAVGGAGYGMVKHDQEKRNLLLSNGAINPANYGMGINAMRRGPQRNYGPSLTLMLHQNHSRVMP